MLYCKKSTWNIVLIRIQACSTADPDIIKVKQLIRIQDLATWYGSGFFGQWKGTCESEFLSTWVFKKNLRFIIFLRIWIRSVEIVITYYPFEIKYLSSSSSLKLLIEFVFVFPFLIVSYWNNWIFINTNFNFEDDLSMFMLSVMELKGTF